MAWFLGTMAGIAVTAVFILLVRVALISSDLHNLWQLTSRKLERLEEDQRTGFITLRLDLGLPSSSMYCGLCLQWTGGDPRKHMDYCRFSYASWVRNFRLHYPGEPLPEGADDPDEQQQQGHRPVPGDPA